MTVGHKPVTAEGLFWTPDHGLRRELVRGEVRTMAPAANVHGRFAMNVSTPLDQHVRQNDPGVVFAAGTGFKIASDPATVRSPDAGFVRGARVEAIGQVEGYGPEAPDLAVKVVSPNDRFSEVEGKIGDWISAGTRMVLIVNPQGRTATVRLPDKRVKILTQVEAIDGVEEVPGWTLPVSDPFR